MAIDSKRIAKNTLFLYVRLILVLGVTLYTSRVVLDKLGVDDYGLFNVAFSVIGLLSFLNGTLSSGTSRFITFALGRNDELELTTTFSTALCAHILLSGIILIFGETIGIWYVNKVMVCPPERFHAAFLVYQISIVCTIISILQVPFTSEIMAHEKMDFYAYVGIYEAIAKLIIVYLLAKASVDKMVLYALLLCVVQFSVLFFNAIYSSNKFKEVCFKIHFDRGIFQSILKFSGWNVIANVSNTLMSQGVIMLFNAFFSPVVVAAQAISNQISNALMQFVDNVRNAVTPQVIKLYAESKYGDSKRLALQSAEYIFDLLLLFGLPIILIMPNLLEVWLHEVPEYTIDFARLIVLQNILGNFNAAFYPPMVAANKIEKNSIFTAIICVVQYGILYLLFRSGMGPIWTRYLSILFCIIGGFILKPYILWKDVDYSWKEMGVCILRCMRMLLISGLCCAVVYYLIPQESFWESLIVAVIAFVTVGIFSFIFIGENMRRKVLNYVSRKIEYIRR